MNSIFDIINVPLGMLIKAIYTVTSNYAVTLFLFAVIVKLVMFPLGIKQQKGQIKMKKMQPKEQAIRKKYAGRKDTASQQKMQQEIMELYKTENYSPMSGCLPLLIQMPIIFALYNIIRNPLTYISGISSKILPNLKTFVYEKFANLEEFSAIFSKITETTIDRIDEISLIKILDNPTALNTIKSEFIFDNVRVMENFQNIDFTIFGKWNLTDTPAQAGGFLSLLILIPVLNLVFSFLQMKLGKIFNQNPGATDAQNGMAMKIMEYTMPVFIFYMAYTWYSALGLYWVYQSVLGIVQTIILAKIMPMPIITKEDYEEAQRLYGSIKKKKKKKVDTEEEETSSLDKTESVDIAELKDSDEEESNEKYVSNNFKKGINESIKKNYQKTGKKYKVKRKKE